MQHIIRFILDDRIREVDFQGEGLKPTTTVLNYLRSFPEHKGVKEGCAEGDCGACTIVLAEPGPDGKLIYKAYDSCLLFLPMIHGKQLITIENMALSEQNHKSLHPVQEMMVETNGSQCGYCTPGIVMSLFGLYKNHHEPSTEIIEDTLTGNLCRCTGYESIIKAAKQACSDGGNDHFSLKEKETLEILQEIVKNKESLELRAKDQIYLKPFSLEEALQMRKEHPEAIVINGSTDVALRQTKKKEHIPAILDISGIEEMKNYSEDEGHCTFGSGMSLEDFKRLTETRFPALHGILKVFGSLQIRNIATLGGNIGSASPIGDTLPVLFACKARLELSSLKNKRKINIEDFIQGYRKTDLKADELITSVIIPNNEKGIIIWSHKVSKRKDLDISTVNAGFRLKLEEGMVKEIILAYGGMAEVTKRALKAEKFLKEKKWSRENVEEAMQILATEFKPISDARSGAEFRTAAAKNLLLKFYTETSHGK